MFLSAVASATGCDNCLTSSSTTPQVYRIAGAASTEDAYEVLFLGAGFTSDDELASYRYAAETLASNLLATAPYSTYPAELSFWRVDVRGGSIKTSACTASCGHAEVAVPPPKLAATALETLNPSGSAVIKKDLAVELCYGGNACRVLWATADAETTAIDLADVVATFGPDIDAIVILANTTLQSGAAVEGTPSASMPLIVVGFPSDTTQAISLLAHELGHAFGLADEYQDGTGVAATVASDYANVWEPTDPCYDPPSYGTPTASTDPEVLEIPWSRTLACDAGLSDPTLMPDPTLDCDQDSKFDDFGCPMVWAPSHNLAACANVTPSLKDGCKSFIGLYEGAFYAMSGVYRSAFDCKMKNLGVDYCGACKNVISDFFKCNYVSPGSCP